jgi:hypothetical protein
MTIEEELVLLEDGMRRLKIEWDMYFGGGAKRPPMDAQWRVETTIKRLDGTRTLNFGQRFRLNAMIQRHAIHADLWRQKLKRREEGREGPQGRRVDVKPAPPPEPAAPNGPGTFRVQWDDPEKDPDKVGQLFNALMAAKKHVGENVETINIDGFRRFVKQKTDQLKRDMRCQNVEYLVVVENGKVSLKAKGA